MKILQLKFKNLNSIYGEWAIDFTAPEYNDNEIFSLTGPTGAGKSTILDAICLALYGETPRLGKITQSTNEIMSRHTGECYAEVVFESQMGTFLCHWEQRRAHKKSNGELQSPEHQIANGLDGTILASQINSVRQEVLKATGMDFNRFTRSILLAQGNFDTFLKASNEEKSKTLEQITGTEIYSQISQQTHTRFTDEKKKLELLQAEIKGITFLSDKEEQTMHEDVLEKQTIAQKLEKTIIQNDTQYRQLQDVQKLKHELDEFNRLEQQLYSELADFELQKQKLTLAEKTFKISPLFAQLSEVRKQHQFDSSELQKLSEAFPRLKQSESEITETLKSFQQKTYTAKENLKIAQPVIKEIRIKDQQITEKTEFLNEQHRDCIAFINKKEAQLLELEQQENNLVETQSLLHPLIAYLKSNNADEWLITGFTGIEVQLQGLLAKQTEINAKQTELSNETVRENKEKQAVLLQEQAYSEKLQELTDMRESLQQQKDTLKTLLNDKELREYRSEKDALLREQVLLARIVELETYRTSLEDGKPCPLCGSIHHPYAKENIPSIDETTQKIQSLTTLIENAEAQEYTIQQYLEKERSLEQELTAIEHTKNDLSMLAKLAKKNTTLISESIEKIQAECHALQDDILSTIIPLGITTIPDDINSLLNTLEQRRAQWHEISNQKTIVEAEITNQQNEVEKRRALIHEYEETIGEKEKQLQGIKQTLNTLVEERSVQYGDKNCDEEEEKLTQAVSNAEAEEKKINQEHILINRQIAASLTSIQNIEKRIADRSPELTQLEESFLQSLNEYEFKNEEHFCAARLSDVEYQRLLNMSNQFEQRKTELSTRKMDCEQELNAKLQKNLPTQSLEELKTELNYNQSEQKKLHADIATLEYALKENENAKAHLFQKQTTIEAQKKECVKWQNLHALIGSADGKKYRTFVQGLTFKFLISAANMQLQKLSDRYLLEHRLKQKAEDKDELSLNVIDNYQAGEKRPTENLSGGESFIVSLALALGLSSMASKKVTVNSLFLDEGFGTLDEDALEVALDTLASLKQDGKLIGIISHVSALKERIGTQIIVSPQTSGKSIIKGPGVKKL